MVKIPELPGACSPPALEETWGRAVSWAARRAAPEDGKGLGGRREEEGGREEKGRWGSEGGEEIRWEEGRDKVDLNHPF